MSQYLKKCQSNPTLSRLIYDYQNNQKINQQQQNKKNNYNKYTNKNLQQIYIQTVSNIHNSPSSRLTNNLTQKIQKSSNYYDNSNKQKSYFNTPMNIKHSFLIQKQNTDLYYEFRKNKQIKQDNKSYLDNSNNLFRLKQNLKYQEQTSYDEDQTQENSRRMKVIRVKDKQFRFNSPENYKVVCEDYQNNYINNTNQKVKSNKNNKHINIKNNNNINNNNNLKRSPKYLHNRNLNQDQICQKQSILSLCQQLKQIQNTTHRPSTSINHCQHHQHINCTKLTDQKLMYLRMIQKYQKQNILLGIQNKKLQNMLVKKQENEEKMKSKIYQLMFEVEKLKRENQKLMYKNSNINKNVKSINNQNNQNQNNNIHNDHKNNQKRVKKFNQISQHEQIYILQTQQKQQTLKNINILTSNHKNDQSSLFEISKSPSKFYDLQISAFDSMFVPPMSKNQRIQELEQMFQKLLQKSLQAKGNQKVQIRQKLAEISDQMKRLRQK